MEKTKKEKLVEARALISQGETLKEASQKTGLSIDTLKKYSSKEDWLSEQRKFFEEMYFQLQKRNLKRVLKNRQEAIENLFYIQDKTMELLREDKLSVDKALKVILDIEKGLNELLGILTPLEIAKLEVEMAKLEKLKDDDVEQEGDILQIEVIE